MNLSKNKTYVFFALGAWLGYIIASLIPPMRFTLHGTAFAVLATTIALIANHGRAR